jgi:hypothetical protein
MDSLSDDLGISDFSFKDGLVLVPVRKEEIKESTTPVGK